MSVPQLVAGLVIALRAWRRGARGRDWGVVLLLAVATYPWQVLVREVGVRLLRARPFAHTALQGAMTRGIGVGCSRPAVAARDRAGLVGSAACA